MEVFKYEEWENGLVLIYENLENKVIDTLGMGMLRTHNFEGILPVSYATAQNGENVLKFNIDNKVSLTNYMSEQLSKVQVSDILLQIIDILEEADEYMFMTENFQLKCEYIMIDKASSDVSLLYLPCINSISNGDMETFISEFMNYLKSNDSGLKDYCSKVLDYIENKQFAYNEFKELILKLKNEPEEIKQNTPVSPMPVPVLETPPQPVKPIPVPIPGTKVPEPVPPVVPIPAPQPPVSPIAPPPESFSKPVQYVPKAGETSVLFASDLDNVSNVQQPYIISEKTGIRTDVTVDEFSIGKDNTNNCIIGDNPTVSRKHAKIINRYGSYYIVDTNSKNHTYVNMQMLNPNEEMQLNHSDKLRFSNEDYTFYTH